MKVHNSDQVLEQTNIRFQGQYYDEETGLHYNHYRYYEPHSGRYVSKDPIGLFGGFNTSAYVSDPNQWVDPLGLNKIYQHKISKEFGGSKKGPDYQNWIEISPEAIAFEQQNRKREKERRLASEKSSENYRAREQNNLAIEQHNKRVELEAIEYEKQIKIYQENQNKSKLRELSNFEKEMLKRGERLSNVKTPMSRAGAIARCQARGGCGPEIDYVTVSANIYEYGGSASFNTHQPDVFISPVNVSASAGNVLTDRIGNAAKKITAPILNTMKVADAITNLSPGMRVLKNTNVSVTAAHVKNLDETQLRGEAVSTFMEGEAYTGSVTIPRVPVTIAMTVPAAHVDNGDDLNTILSKPYVIEVGGVIKGSASPIDVTRSKNYKVK